MNISRASNVTSNSTPLQRLYGNDVLIWQRVSEGFDRTVQVHDWAGLRNAVIAAAAGERTQIVVMNNMPTDLPTGALTLAAGRDITITSNGETPSILKRYTLSHLYFIVNGILRLENIELHGDAPANMANHGGIQVNAGGQLHMNWGSAIKYCMRNTTAGSAVSITGQDALLVLNGGEIAHNISFVPTVNSGASAIYVVNRATMIMNSGEIHDNIGRFGGAIQVITTSAELLAGATIADTRLYLNGGTVHNNTALFGGCVNVENATLEIDGVTIRNNHATGLSNPPATTINANRGGGGVFLQNNAVATMHSGEIIENTSGNHGGGVMLLAGTTFTMLDGEIIDNIATGSGKEVWRVGTAVFNHMGGQVGRNIIAEGSIGTNGAPWTLHDNGRVTVRPGFIDWNQGAASPWHGHRDLVTEISFSGTGYTFFRTRSLFAQLTSLHTINGMDTWDTSSVVLFTNMFRDTHSLTNLDLSSWDTGSSTSMSSMLQDANNLRKLKLGDHFGFETNARLVNVPNNVEFTGIWQNVGMGTVENPQGDYTFTSAQLMAQYDGTIHADTWVWQRRA